MPARVAPVEIEAPAMSPPPQKQVFSAEIQLGRLNGHANGHNHAYGSNGAAVSSAGLDEVRDELKRLADRIDKLTPAGAVITSVTGEAVSVTARGQGAREKVRHEGE